jgi:hypothetical protein
MRREYDTDLFTTWPIAWARADGLASAVGRYRLRGGARGRCRVLAGRPNHSTIVYMLGLRGGLPSRRGDRTSMRGRDLGALRKICCVRESDQQFRRGPSDAQINMQEPLDGDSCRKSISLRRRRRDLTPFVLTQRTYP